MKIEYSNEIIKNFKEQFPEKIKDFNSLINNIQGFIHYEKTMQIYNDLIFSLDFLIALIRRLEK